MTIDSITSDPISFLQCPIDRQPLTRQQSSVRCKQGHCYDIARGGYINLLLPQHKRSRAPGDSKEMVQSRRTFLNSGYYAPIAEAINKTLYQAVSTLPNRALSPTIMDVACGEGFYLSQARSFLLNHQLSSSCFGIDISKVAIKAATQRDREITWIVGSTADLPIADGSLDIMLCTFFKVDFLTFCKKLKPNGRLIIAVPNPRHLIELRELIYDTVHQKKIDYQAQAMEGQMVLHTQQDLVFKVDLPDATTLHNLFTMTPHYWRTNPKGRERLAQQTKITLTADISIQTFAPKQPD